MPKNSFKTGSGHYYYMYLLKIQYTDLVRTKFLSTKILLVML